ncbi:hypothetical protein K438DRAFT_1966288 [Mycena galopus ATCC 62051]|nr:hypothetical protein K438DRAFT_1966288 [Mycena galopus ATCC 62051]
MTPPAAHHPPIAPDFTLSESVADHDEYAGQISVTQFPSGLRILLTPQWATMSCRLGAHLSSPLFLESTDGEDAKTIAVTVLRGRWTSADRTEIEPWRLILWIDPIVHYAVTSSFSPDQDRSSNRKFPVSIERIFETALPGPSAQRAHFKPGFMVHAFHKRCIVHSIKRFENLAGAMITSPLFVRGAFHAAIGAGCVVPRAVIKIRRGDPRKSPFKPPSFICI